MTASTWRDHARPIVARVLGATPFAQFLVDIARRCSVATALLALVLLACGAPVDHGPIILSPTPETRELVEHAASEWIASTGIPVLIGAGGIPVSTSSDEVVDMHGVSVCGFTEVTRMKQSHEFVRIERVLIATRPPPGCPGWQTGHTVLHELGHVVCNHGVDELTANDCHSPEGLMATHANGTDTIDAVSLDVVCSYAPCAWIDPN
jgi:hypothetical protein